jgi:hypothetical protein
MRRTSIRAARFLRAGEILRTANIASTKLVQRVYGKADPLTAQSLVGGNGDC